MYVKSVCKQYSKRYSIMFPLTNEFFNLSLDKKEESKQDEGFIPNDLIPNDSVLGRLLQEDFAPTSILPHNTPLTELTLVYPPSGYHGISDNELNILNDMDNLEHGKDKDNMDESIESINVENNQSDLNQDCINFSVTESFIVDVFATSENEVIFDQF